MPSPASTCAAPSGVARSADATSAARCGCRSLATSTAPRWAASAASRAALPPGPGAQVEPPLVTTVHRGVGERERDDLRTLVLDAGASLGDRRDGGRVATGQGHGVRRPAGAGAAGGLELLDGRHAGAGDQRDPRRGVVGLQQRVELLVAADGRGQRLPQRRDDPAGVGPGDGEVGVRVVLPVGGDLVDPPGEVAPADRAQDGVDQAGRSPADGGADEVDAGRDRSVVGDPHGEQLVRPQPQHVAHLRLEPRLGEAGVDHGVVQPVHPDRPGRQLGGQRGVATGEPVLAQDLRQHEVGVGVVGAHGREHVERRAAGLVDRAAAVSHRGAPARASSAPSPPRRR